MKTLLSMALFLTIGTAAFAGGIPWHVTIYNQTGNDAYIYPGGNDNWDLQDFGYNQILEANFHWVYNTEDESFWNLVGVTITPGIVGLNINYGYGYQHVEMWNDSHPYSVTKNISSCRTGSGDDYIHIGSSSDFVTTAIRFEETITLGTVYATINLLPQTGNGCAAAADDVSGDGIADAAMVSNGTWHVWLSSTGFAHSGPHDLGLSGTPLLGDMDGDGLADPVVMDSAGTWYVWASAANTTVRYANSWVLLSEYHPNCWESVPYDKIDMLYIAFGHTQTTNGAPYFDVVHTDRSRLSSVVQDAKAKNPDIKILISLGWESGDLSNIFPGGSTNYVNQYAQSVANFVKSNGLDGFDIDWEGPHWPGGITIDNTQFQLLATNIRQKLNNINTNYLFTLSPAVTVSLDGDTINETIDYLNLQTYCDPYLPGKFESMNISASKLVWGSCLEPNYLGGQTASQVAINAYQSAVSANLTGVFTWRMNSDNWQDEQSAQVTLYNLVHLPSQQIYLPALSSKGSYQMSGPYALGVPGTPLVADFDGDGKCDPAVSVQTIYGRLWVKWLSGSNYQQDSIVAFGDNGAQPVAGDIDGDGKADYATVDETGNWLLKLSSLNYAVDGPYALGVAGRPLLADFDADGKADPVMVESSGNWYVWPSASGYVRNGPHVLSVP